MKYCSVLMLLIKNSHICFRRVERKIIVDSLSSRSYLSGNMSVSYTLSCPMKSLVINDCPKRVKNVTCPRKISVISDCPKHVKNVTLMNIWSWPQMFRMQTKGSRLRQPGFMPNSINFYLCDFGQELGFSVTQFLQLQDGVVLYLYLPHCGSVRNNLVNTPRHS